EGGQKPASQSSFRKPGGRSPKDHAPVGCDRLFPIWHRTRRRGARPLERDLAHHPVDEITGRLDLAGALEPCHHLLPLGGLALAIGTSLDVPPQPADDEPLPLLAGGASYKWRAHHVPALAHRAQPRAPVVFRGAHPSTTPSNPSTRRFLSESARRTAFR